MTKYYVASSTQAERHTAFLERHKKFDLPQGRSQLWSDFPSRNVRLFKSAADAANVALYHAAEHNDQKEFLRTYRSWGEFVSVQTISLPVVYEVEVDDALDLGSEKKENITKCSSLGLKLRLQGDEKVRVNYFELENANDLTIKTAAVLGVGDYGYTNMQNLQMQVMSNLYSAAQTSSAACTSLLQTALQTTNYISQSISGLWRQQQPSDTSDHRDTQTFRQS